MFRHWMAGFAGVGVAAAAVAAGMEQGVGAFFGVAAVVAVEEMAHRAAPVAVMA